MSKRKSNKKIKFVFRGRIEHELETPAPVAAPVAAEQPSVTLQQASNSPRQLGLSFEPSASQLMMPTPVEEVSLDDPASAIRHIARGFRLSFSWIPGMSHTLSGAEKHEWLSNALTAAQKRAASVKKNLYAPHKAISRLSSARSKVKTWFQDHTNPFPEKSVRIFLVEPHPTPEKCTANDLEKYEAAQVARFRTEFQSYISSIFDSAVANLQENWPSVIDAARTMLQDRFDEKDYVSANDIPYYVRCWFEPVNLDLSKEWKYLTSVEQARELALIQQKYKLAVAKQEEYVVGLLLESLQSLSESLAKANASYRSQPKFYSSTVERVFNALEEFKMKTLRYGILKGSNVEKIFDEVNRVLQVGGYSDKESIASAIRRNTYQRERLTEAVDKIRNDLSALITEGAVRRKITTSL